MSNIESLPAPFTLQSAAAGAGVGNVLSVRGYGMAALQVTGVFVATITPQVTLDGVNQIGVSVVNAATGAVSTTITGPGIYLVPVAGLEALQANVTAFTSGTVTVIGRGFPLTQPSTAGAGGIGTPGSPSVVRIEDATTTLLNSVGSFHNSDNQTLPATGGALLTAGVAQLLNSINNADRQRETGQDNIVAQGVPAGTQQLKSPISTTLNGAVLAGATAATLAATKFTNRGSQAWVAVGSVLVLEGGTANQESVVVLTVNYGTQAITVAGLGTGGANTGFKFAHGSGVSVTAGAYNEARDATAPDGSTGAGFAAGATYLLNSSLNAGAGGWEGERSAAGELDGASGVGTAVAAEYEYNSGGPGGGNFDRARNLQGKGVTTATLNGAANAGQALATLTGAVPPVGQAVYFQGGVAEVGYVLSVAGQVVTLTANLANTHGTGTNVQWDSYVGPIGPGLSGFLPTGVGIEEEALFDPITGLYFVERSATADNAPPQNVVMENECLWNGTGMDRARTNISVVALASASQPVGTFTSPDQLNVNGHALHVIVDMTVPGAGSTVVTVNAKDPASGKYYPLLASAALTTVATTVLRIGPALTAVANQTANDWVPRTFQIVAVTSAAAQTFSIGYNLSE